jgi:hypothetical protein
VPTVRISDTTPVAPERVLAAARDFSARRAELWPDVHVEDLHVHEIGATFAEVTEGNPWPIGRVWERLRYDWTDPGAVRGTVVDSNLFRPGSTWEIHAHATDDGATRVDVVADRRLRWPRGWLIAPFFPLGSARRTVAAHLRHFLAELEAEGVEPP